MATRGRTLGWAAGVLIGLPMLLLALIAGRLAYGPIALDFLRPSLERALGAADESFAVRLGATELAWDRVDREPQLRVRDVRVVGQGGNAVATAGTVVLRLAVRPLLRGVIAPADIRLLEPRLEIARHPDGTLDLGIGAEGGTTDQRLDVRALVGSMAGAPSGVTTAPSLREFSARGATIEITDRSSGRSWRLEGADLTLRPDPAGLVGSLVGRLRVADRIVPVRSIARYRPNQERATIAVRFRGLDPGLFTSVGLHMPFDGAVVASLDTALRPIDVRGHIRGSAGRLTIPDLASEPIEVDSLRAKGSFDARARRLHMQRLTLAHGISRVHLPGTLAWNEGGQVAVDARASGERLPLETLGHWWPAGLATPVRRWVVEHLRGGIVQSIDIVLQGTIGGPSGGVAVRPVGGKIAFDGIAVRLDDRFPPATDVAGTARLDQGELTVRGERGRMGTIEVIGASATVPLSAAPHAHTQLTVAFRGPMAEALGLLDREPFGYARALGLEPAAVSGTTTAHLAVAVPHGAPRAGARPTVTGSARLAGVGVPRVLGGASMSDGEIALELEDGRLRVTGTARLAGAPISVAWDESTRASAGPTRRVTVTGRLDSMSRTALGYDLSPWLQGPVDVEAKLVASADGSGSLDLHAGLHDATIDPGIPRMRKPAGVASAADGRLTLVHNVVTRVDQLTIEAGPTTITGSAARDGSSWLSASLQATLAGFAKEADGRFALTVQRQQNGYEFRVGSDDAGTLFDAIVGDDRLDGGRLVVEGTAQTTGGSLILAGTLDARNVVVQRSPVLARVATLASLSGIRSALEREGLPFDRVGANLEYREPHLSIRDGLARGKALAVAVDGMIDGRAATADLSGTVIPSYYGLNTVPGRIPVLGEVVGGRAEAVQAIDFTVTGALADPRVQVKPVSTLAPGVLRDLMQKLRE